VELRGTPSKQLQALVKLAHEALSEAEPQVKPGFIPNRQRRLTAAEAAEIREAYLNGASLKAISRQNTINRTAIRTVLERAGIHIREQRHIQPAEINQAIRLYHQGWSLGRIGDRLVFDAETIRQQLKRQGVAMRAPNQPKR